MMRGLFAYPLLPGRTIVFCEGFFRIPNPDPPDAYIIETLPACPPDTMLVLDVASLGLHRHPPPRIARQHHRR